MRSSHSQKQLNIRSDEAYARAHRLAAQRGTSVTQIIELALEVYDARIGGLSSKLTPRMAEDNKLRLNAALAQTWGGDGPPTSLNSDHSWLYDEHGLPK